MTNREFYNAIINSDLSEELITFAQNEITKLDARNDKRRNTLTKEQIANEELKTAIVELLADKGMLVASTIATTLGVSTQKVSALAKQLVESGKVVAEDVKVKGKGAVKGYKVVE